MVNDEEAATTSDHEVISWTVLFDSNDNQEEESPAYGWKVGELVGDEEKAERAGVFWRREVEKIPTLEPWADRRQIEEWARHLQLSTILTLDTFAQKARICARSKRWWSPEIGEARKAVGKARKRWQRTRCEGDYVEYKTKRNSFSDLIRQARKECWSSFLEQATGDDLWTVIR